MNKFEIPTYFIEKKSKRQFESIASWLQIGYEVPSTIQKIKECEQFCPGISALLIGYSEYVPNNTYPSLTDEELNKCVATEPFIQTLREICGDDHNANCNSEHPENCYMNFIEDKFPEYAEDPNYNCVCSFYIPEYCNTHYEMINRKFLYNVETNGKYHGYCLFKYVIDNKYKSYVELNLEVIKKIRDSYIQEVLNKKF